MYLQTDHQVIHPYATVTNGSNIKNNSNDRFYNIVLFNYYVTPLLLKHTNMQRNKTLD